MADGGKRIRIITIQGIPNFGSAFQSMALCRYLTRCGYGDTEVIDYNPSYFRPHTLRSMAGVALNLRDCRLRDRRYRDFLAANVPLTSKRFASLRELEDEEFDADVFIAGGDQLWNVYHDCGRDDAYKLTFARGKKISYGTSLGQSGFTDEQLSYLAEKIGDFSAVSVRESTSVGMLASKGIAAKHVADPVFLLDQCDYEDLLVDPDDGRYLLVYMVTPSKLLEDCIERLAKRHGLKVVLCFGLSKKCTCDKHDKAAGPAEILGYIKNAEFVLSASYHATAFATMFQKQFFTLLPDRHTNERILDYLSMRGLEGRIVTEATDLERALGERIDYTIPDDYTQFVKQSKRYLQRALEL